MFSKTKAFLTKVIAPTVILDYNLANILQMWVVRCLWRSPKHCIEGGGHLSSRRNDVVGGGIDSCEREQCGQRTTSAIRCGQKVEGENSRSDSLPYANVRKYTVSVEAKGSRISRGRFELRSSERGACNDVVSKSGQKTNGHRRGETVSFKI